VFSSSRFNSPAGRCANSQAFASRVVDALLVALRILSEPTTVKRMGNEVRRLAAERSGADSRDTAVLLPPATRATTEKAADKRSPIISPRCIANTCSSKLLPLTKIPRMVQLMPLVEPEPPKTKLGESFVRLMKATTTYVGVEIVKRFVPASFLRSLDDFKKGRVVSDDVALNTTPPKM
jgi:hypothetical protein